METHVLRSRSVDQFLNPDFSSKWEAKKVSSGSFLIGYDSDIGGQRIAGYFFDYTALESLRSRNDVLSIKLRIKADNLPHGPEYLDIAYALADATDYTVGGESIFKSDAESTAASTDARIADVYSLPKASDDGFVTLDLTGKKLPVYGYLIGPHSANSNAIFAFEYPTYPYHGTQALLTVITGTSAIIYDANGGVGAPSSHEFMAGTPVVLSSNTPTRIGATFKGWSSEIDGAVQYLPGGTYTFENNITLYAVWELATYTVKFDKNDGTGSGVTLPKTYGIDLTIPSESREGYLLLGWSFDSMAMQPEYTEGESYSVNGNRTLFAVWELIVSAHTLSYDANGGTGAPVSESKEYSVENQTFFSVSTTEPIRYGYSFLGWAASASSTEVEYIGGETVSASNDVHLYAVWLAVTYTISFDANGGDGAPSAQVKTFDIDITLPDVSPTREGFIFVGWAEHPDAVEADYAAGGVFNKNADLTLYAVWLIKTYSITFNANGGENAPIVQQKKHGEPIAITRDIPFRARYVFRGWALSQYGSIAYQPGDIYTVNEPLILYARWRVATEMAVTVLQGGSLVECQVNVQDGESVPCTVYV